MQHIVDAFLGDQSPWFLLEIVARTTVLYLYTVVLVRFLGKRGAQPFAPFELVIIIALGSAVGDPMFYADVPISHGFVVVTAVVILERTIGLVSSRVPAVDRFLESQPQLIVADGQLLDEGLSNEISFDDVFSALRMEGIRDLGEIWRAYIEPSGRVSVFRSANPTTTRSVLPNQGAGPPDQGGPATRN